MALSNADRQRRYRQNLLTKARHADISEEATIAAVYELLRKQWLLHEDSDRGPAEQAYREVLAAIPPDARSVGERLGYVSEILFAAVGGIIDRTYHAKIKEKRRIDRAGQTSSA